MTQYDGEWQFDSNGRNIRDVKEFIEKNKGSKSNTKTSGGMGDILQGKSHIQSHRTTSKSNGTASPNSSNISTRELHSPLNDFDIKAEKELIDFKKQIKADITEINRNDTI